MEGPTSAIESLFEKATDYLETRADLLKLQAVDKSSAVTASFVSRLVIILTICFFIFILTIGIALWVGEELGKTYYGFFIVAVFYGIAALVLYLFRYKWIKQPVSNLIIKKLLN